MKKLIATVIFQQIAFLVVTIEACRVNDAAGELAVSAARYRERNEADAAAFVDCLTLIAPHDEVVQIRACVMAAAVGGHP